MRRNNRAPIRVMLRCLLLWGLVVIPRDGISEDLPRGGAYQGVPSIEWSPCYEQIGPFECALFEVPLSHSEEASKDFYLDETIPGIDLALIRLPARNQAAKIGSLFLNPGGPGGSGIDYVLAVGRGIFSFQVGARFDIVGLDPRGTNSSNALSCFTSLDHLDALSALPAYPQSRSEIFAQLRFDRKFRRSCRRNAGRIIDHMSTADVARDLDILRQAVGDEQLSYAGVSYGSFLGITYANLFPERVRAMILDGVLDPIAWSTGSRRDRHFPVSWRVRSDAGAMATLEEFFRLCDVAGPKRCAFSRGAAGRFAALLDQLAEVPAKVPQPGAPDLIIDDATLISLTLGALYNSFGWKDYAEFLALLELQAAPQSIQDALRAFEAPGREHEPNLAPQTIEAVPGVMCSDADNPRHARMWPLAAKLAEHRFGYFGPLWTWFSSACARWPGSQDTRYVGPFDRQTANPVLVTSTLFDPATRYEGATTVAELLPNSHLLTVEGWGHTTLFLSRCADQIASAYLLSGVLPDEDSTCRQDFPPFGLFWRETLEDGEKSVRMLPEAQARHGPTDARALVDAAEVRARAMRSVMRPRRAF